jgi:hypothetical protein
LEGGHAQDGDEAEADLDIDGVWEMAFAWSTRFLAMAPPSWASLSSVVVSLSPPWSMTSSSLSNSLSGAPDSTAALRSPVMLCFRLATSAS